ncbi:MULTISPECIES: universal stress protein [Paraburkholderia]|uniref:Nucleotide-binding universal stress UspA family protein n=1 Tax=Paraburkholderia tropica TaxID=92647 RepID=A0A1A5XJU8_9BURK|nr:MULTISPECIES: universal stress protein [Paraburkholderia]MBB2981171.1 nucleotide-binding universal stress UspA family protein [Paraburkholderia tropica]MDE1138514.1 universal stress protein [Paraburkholderia tropica]OBR53435.1 universal stress protein UspA [Paraburkholderia tropica]PXX06445.1 nucleotide-binding universal stress UspA family protein [Paraburkholderia tropica]PZW72179.1 nucleotide-binding universal stress UspA family protein [Paraburkholderia tropica]
MFSRILVALDGSQTASKALDAAIELARDSAAELQPLYVIDMPMLAYDVPGFDPSIIRDAYVEESRILGADAQNRMTGAGVRGAPRTAEVQLGADDIAQCIERAAADWHADLIVMGTHGRRGMQRLALGSVAERVLRSACRPVLLIPARATAKERA